MKYCRKCGTKMSDDALFCSKCGCKVIEPKDLDVTEDAAENEQAEGNESANTPDLDLQPVVSQPVKSVSEENSEAKSSYGKTRVQYSTPSNTPPLLDELSSMYKNISRSSLILSIVDMIGTIDWILLGIAFVSWDRLLIPGILFIIYGVGMWIAAVMNFKEYLKARKVSNQLHTDPPQTLREVIDTFRYEAENEKLFRSLSTLDTVNILFRFYNVGKYVIKYRCINDYLSENKDSLDIILKAYSRKSVQSNNPDEELRKQKEAFSAVPKTDYQKKLRIRIRAIIVGIILIVLIPVLIVLNKSMRDPEYAKYIGEKYGHTNTATQQTTKLQSYTAEEFINRYNELASNSGGKVEKFDFSKATKESDAYGVPYYCIVNDNLDKSIILVLDGNDYSGIVKRIRVNYLIPKRQASVYPYEIANSITVFINDMSLLDACSICEQTMKQKKYTPPSISGITLQYEKDDINDREKWLIQLSNFDSTTVQPSNQTDTKTEENSKVSEKETSTVQESEDSQYYETSERLDSEQSSENEPIEEDPRILKEGKENAEKMLNKNYDKNNYAPEQQKEIESIIEKYMKLINNASSSSEINRLYSVALNQIKNVKTNIPQKIYDKIIEMINDLKEEGKTDITYSFGNIKNADNLFLFIQYCDPYDSEYYYNVNEIDFQYGYCAERSIKFGPAFDGATTISSAHALTIDDENQVGYYYLYPSGRYDYGKILSSTVYNGLIFTSDLSDGTIHYQSDPIPSFPGKYLEFVSVNDLTLLKKMILGETDSAAETTNETVYSDKVFYYNGVIYYTPEFAGEGAGGYLDFSKAGEKYKALPLPDYTDAESQGYNRKVDIDSFLIVDDIVYFTDQEPGTGETPPAKLYRMNLDGSNTTLMTSNVGVGLCYKDGNLYFSTCYPSYDPYGGISGITYSYNISKEQMTTVDENISFDKANVIFSGQSAYYGGVYYTEPHYSGYIKTDRGDYYNLVYYRLDNDTNTEQIVGYAYVPQF